MNTQDVTIWATEELHKRLTAVIMGNQWRDCIYYLLVFIKDSYNGKLGALGHKVVTQDYFPAEPAGEKTIDLSKKKVAHNIITIMDRPPPAPFIGTMLWQIDNSKGRAKCIYILPADKPIVWGEEMGESSEFIFNSAVNSAAPIIYN